jgi:CzcA family heavy metal efflux pump
MLTGIVRFALRHPGVIVALACAALGFGVFSAYRAEYDVFPEFAPPEVQIQTESPGLSPVQVETLITQPIENVLNGVSGIETLRSGSIQGLSVVTAIFRSGTDVYRARQEVAERLTILSGRLPPGMRPVMTPLTSSTSIVLAVGMTSEKHSLMELTTVADWTVKPCLLAVPGVAKVAVFGAQVKQLQIQLRPDRLLHYNLSPDEVLAVARRATGIRGAGFIDTPNQRILLQTEGQSITPDELARTVVLHQDYSNVTLAQVADVADAPQPPFGASTIMGRPGVVLMVSEQYGANTLTVSRDALAALAALRPTLDAQGITLHLNIFQPAEFIRTALANLNHSLLVGAALVILVLFLFLFEWRTAVISCTAIPLSLLAAVAVLVHLGFSINTLTLGGLAIAIGEVVDDAVIDVENILRRLRQNRHAENPRPAIRVILDASIEVRSAVVYATFAVVLVFFPILAMSGLAGRLFAPLGIAYIMAVMVSLVVALTVTPALCLLLLGRGELKRQEPPLIRWLKRRYTSLLGHVERHSGAVISAALLLVIGGGALIPLLGREFLPHLNEGHFIVHMSLVPGTSLEESLRVGRQITQRLLEIAGIRSVAQRVGRAEEGDDILGTQDSEFEVDLKPLPGRENERVMAEIRRMLDTIPGGYFSVNSFLTERIEETLSGYTAAIAINIVGNDLDVLDAKGRQIAQILEGIRGAVDVRIESMPQTPQLVVRLRKDAIARWGFDPVQVLDAVRIAYQGDIAGQVYEGNQIFDVSVILAPRSRETLPDVGDLPVRDSAGNYLSLKHLADIYEAAGRYSVLHEAARRVQIVTANVAGRDVASVVREARQRITSGVTLPPGTYIEYMGTAEAQARSRNELLVYSALVGLGIILLLAVVTQHYRNLLLVLLNLPLALVGGVLAAFFTTGTLTLGSLVGFVTLFGITLRNSIMLISHYEHLVAVEGQDWNLATAIRGASERLAPIFMTALVTGLGLLPLAIGAGAPGREIEGAMAQVILGGLITSTLLNLLVLPTLALRFGRFSPSVSEL